MILSEENSLCVCWDDLKVYWILSYFNVRIDYRTWEKDNKNRFI